MESLVNFSPAVVVALNRGEGSLSLGSATRPRAARSKAHASAPGRRMDRADMQNVIQLGLGLVNLLCWYRSRDLAMGRSEEHTSELQSRVDLVCRLLLEKK